MTATLPSCVFLTTPTSGTGSLWRMLTRLTQGAYEKDKVTERLVNEGRAAEIAAWQPEPTGHLYMYNTSQIANFRLNDPAIKLIVNVRDPRDMACNQFYWAQQHPRIGEHTEEQLAEFRRAIEAKGIDRYSLDADNTMYFKAHRCVLQRLLYDRADTLCVSYTQLCLDMDGMLQRIADFLGPAANRDAIPGILISERTENLASNQGWIGNLWHGHDTGPGRHRGELKPETVAELDTRYAETLTLLQQIELPQYRHFYDHTPRRGSAQAAVVQGRDGYLFLANDTNRVIEQLQGRFALSGQQRFEIAVAHRLRRRFLQEEIGAAYLHVLVPNKETVLPHLLPDDIRPQSHGLTPVNAFFEDLNPDWNCSFFRPNLLRRLHDTEPTFGRMDTHWTHFGALSYLGHALRAAGLAEAAAAFAAVPREVFSGVQAGDLGSKIGAAAESVRLIRPAPRKAKQLFANGVVNEGCVRLMRNDVAPVAQRLLLLHDSTGNWVLDFLAETFVEVMAIHSPDLDLAFVSRYRPDLVLFLQIERFFVRTPKNDVSYLDLVEKEQQRKGGTDCALALLRQPREFPLAA